MKEYDLARIASLHEVRNHLSGMAMDGWSVVSFETIVVHDPTTETGVLSLTKMVFVVLMEREVTP